MNRVSLGTMFACLALVVSGCASGPTDSAGSCVAPEITAQIIEDDLVVSGQYFMDDCADVVANGKALVTPKPIEGIVLTLTQGGLTADLGVVGAREGGVWAVGNELTSISPDLKDGPAVVSAKIPSGYESTTEVTITLP